MLQRLRRERAAVSAAAVEDELARAVGEPWVALAVLEVRAHLEEAARHVARTRKVALGELVGLAHVDEVPAAAVRELEQPPHLLGRDLPHLGERLAHQVR